MPIEGLAIATILGMGLVTFATRAGGLWLMRFIPPTRRVETFLRHLASSVLVALLTGAAVRGDVAAWCAIIVSAVTMITTRRAFLAIGAGMASAALVRFALAGAPLTG